MARKSNKTDHVLNLLSSGNKKKGNDGGAKDKSAPPVQLKKRSGDESDLEAMESAATGQDPEADTTEAGDTAIPSTPSPEKDSAPQPEAIETQPTEPPLSAGTEIPEVSVVQAGGEENPIADAVKDSLEAELDAYLKEEEEGHAATLLEEKENTARGADTEPVADLPDHGSDSEHRADPGTEDELPDLPDHMMNRQQEPPVGPDQNIDTADQNPVFQEPAGNVKDDLPDHVINTATEVLNRQETGAALSSGSNQLAEKPMSAGADTQVGRKEISLNAEKSQPESPKAEPQHETAAQHPAPESEVQERISRGNVLQTPPQRQAAAPAKPGQPAGEPKPQQKVEGPKPPESNEEEDVDYTIVNVMEHLVRDQAPKYIRQFGHCDCRRCIEDTVALALTHLPPKYVVVNKAAASPLLNFYEKRFAGQLIVEITKASMIIHENPHHQI